MAQGTSDDMSWAFYLFVVAEVVAVWRYGAVVTIKNLTTLVVVWLACEVHNHG